MNLFQWLVLPVLSAALLREVVLGIRRSDLTRLWALRCAVWLVAVLAVAFPALAQAIAEVLGITRGADVILYLSVPTLAFACMVLYSRYASLRHEITRLVRHIALEQPRRGSASPPGSEPPVSA